MSDNTEQTFEVSSRSEEIWNTITHGIGIPIGIAGMISLMLRAFENNNFIFLVAVVIYGLSFIWTYTTSTLYHYFFQSDSKLRNRLHLLDHTAIYLFIAGTYTPVALFALPGPWNVGILAGIWFLALAGIIIKVFSIGKYKKLSLVFYLLMGWMIIIALEPLIDHAPAMLLYWLLAGGLFYSLGTIFFSLRKLKYNHAIWHFFVLAGSICHFVGIYKYLDISPAIS